MNIVIYGSGENGLQAYYSLRHHKEFTIVGFLDGNKALHGTTTCGLPVLGDFDAILRLKREAQVEGAIPAIGNNAIRGRVAARLREAGLTLVNAIHPTAMIDSPKHLGEGCIFEMGSAIQMESEVGDGVFVGTAAIVAHHCRIGAFSLLSGGLSLGGGVTIGAYTLMGVGAAVHPHITIGSNVIVGVGAAVVKDVPDNVVVAGVPARIIRELPPLEATGTA